MSDKLKDLLFRALHTFLQAFLAAIVTGGSMGLFGSDWKAAWSALLLAALAAGLSALKTWAASYLIAAPDAEE